MSSINRLLLQGIRSFGPYDTDEAEITFATPLTLICGMNGSGKSTIVEALKYAACGELPARTKGSSFLHDPTLCAYPSVKGHVKLTFNDANGGETTIAREAQVTRKLNKKPEFKTLDTTITQQNGESISTRSTADIDTLMENAFGFSKAILTNVIFCHQEDSNWFLEKSTKNIKDRFDAIFGITEYYRSLEFLRAWAMNLFADKTSETKDAVRYELPWENTEENFENKLAVLENKLNKIVHKETNLGSRLKSIQKIKNKRDSLKGKQEELEKKIKVEFHRNTKEELLETISSIEKDLGNEKAKLLKLEENKDSVIFKKNRYQRNISTKQMQVEVFENEKDQNDERVKCMNLGMNKLADELKLIVVWNCDMNQDRAMKLLNSIEQKLKEEKLALKMTKKEWELKEKKLQSKIDSIREKRVAIEQEIPVKRKNIQDNITEIAMMKQKIEDVDKSAQSLLVTLKKDLAKVEKNLEVMNSVNVNECNARINENISKRNRLEFILSELVKEIKTLKKVNNLRATLHQYSETKRKMELNFNRLKEENSNSLKHLLIEVPQNDFKKNVQKCCDKISSEIKTRKEFIAEEEEKLSILVEKDANFDNEPSPKKRKLDKIIKLGSEIQRLQYKLSETQKDQAVATGLLSDCTKLDDIYRELKTLEQNIKTVEKKITDAVVRKGRTIQQAQDGENDIKVQLIACRKELQNAQNDLSSYQGKFNKLKERKTAIASEIIKTENDIQQKKELSDKVNKLETMSSSYEHRLRHLERDLSPTIEKFNKLSSDLRNLKINHKMKIDEKTKRLNEFNKKFDDIANLLRTIEKYNEKGGDSALDKLRQELVELQLTNEENNRIKEIIEKEIQSIKESIQTREMRKMNFENNLFFKKNEEEISELERKITNDLKQFEEELEQDMTYFHKKRMEMINIIVRDLWKKIYRGNDIDSIEIKMDETLHIAGERKGYNYRVVQVKNDTEFDMQGRCSAGQKVLACLIIRVALLETLCKNCGILTLDEPTTNLDYSNVESLGLVLSDIVTKEITQKNFQLIVITQDVSILNLLIRTDKVNHYLIVCRNESGKSQVQKIKFSDESQISSIFF